MYKKVLLGLTIISLTWLYPKEFVYSQERTISWINAEMGDVIFRDLGEPFLNWLGHGGFYFLSDSQPKEGEDFKVIPLSQGGGISEINIQDSDNLHSVIQVNGYKDELPPEIQVCDVVTLYFALAGKEPWGAYNKSGNLSADDRRDILSYAYQQKQLNPKYSVGGWKKTETPRSIKNPSDKPEKGTFRSDGFIEYIYEQASLGGFFSAKDELDCFPPILFRLPNGIPIIVPKIPTFTPVNLMKKMVKAKTEAPQILSTELWKGGKKIDEYGKLTGEVTIKAKVKDGDKGSGIDKVEFYYNELILNNLIDKKDEDKNDDGVSQEYSCQWDTNGISNYPLWHVYAKVYDRAGNIGKGESFMIGSSYTVDDGFSAIIDHTPPQVANTKPANGQTKVYLGNRIRITFSEEMGTETINEDTILLNNGAVVGSVSYNPDIRSAFFTPTQPLNIGTNYTILVKSGELG
ncbi:MAG: Ig-like domain-containing protein [bacterium]